MVDRGIAQAGMAAVGAAEVSRGGGAAPAAPDLSRVIRGLAGQLHARLPQGCGIDLCDLIQAGNVGLLQAAGTFQPDNGAPLGGYARFRIRGEMLDMVRRNASRHPAARGRVDRGEETDPELVLAAPPETSPHASLTARQRAAIIREELSRLSARDRSVVRMRYGREMTLREIGAKLQVNESRACQIHRSALDRLKKALCSRGLRAMAHL